MLDIGHQRVYPDVRHQVWVVIQQNRHIQCQMQRQHCSKTEGVKHLRQENCFVPPLLWCYHVHPKQTSLSSVGMLVNCHFQDKVRPEWFVVQAIRMNEFSATNNVPFATCDNVLTVCIEIHEPDTENVKTKGSINYTFTNRIWISRYWQYQNGKDDKCFHGTSSTIHRSSIYVTRSSPTSTGSGVIYIWGRTDTWHDTTRRPLPR